MAGRFNLEDYDTVESRIKKFWEQFPDGRIHTQIIHNDDTRFIVQAYVFTDRNDMRAVTSGMAEETIGSSMVTKTSALEVCETSAIGRALANFIFSGNKRPSREEMEKVERYDSKVAKPELVKASPEQIDLAKTALEQVDEIADMEELKNFYKGAQDAGLLYINIEGKNLNNAIGAHKKKLEASK